MPTRGQLVLGAFLVLLGALLLVANVLHINLWALCWPVSLILLGLLLVWRPQIVGETSASGFHLLGDITRSGEWNAQDEELWLFVGDVRLDMQAAQFPIGETVLRLNGFVGDVDLRVPSEVGVMLSASGFVVDARLLDQKVSRMLAVANLTTGNYASAERKLRVVTAFFIGDVDVIRA